MAELKKIIALIENIEWRDVFGILQSGQSFIVLVVKAVGTLNQRRKTHI